MALLFIIRCLIGFDHVMYKGLKLKSIKKINADGLSDHDALVAESLFNKYI